MISCSKKPAKISDNCLYFDQKTGEIKREKPADIDLRSERYRLQRAAHRILGHSHRIGVCHCNLGHNKDQVEVMKNASGKSGFSGLAVCANAWACPVCSSKIAINRAVEVRKGFSWAKKEKLHISMITLTVRHTREQSAKELADLVTGSWRNITGHDNYKKQPNSRSSGGLKYRFGVRGYIRALEVTHGHASGFHPHLHIIIYSERKLSRAFEREIFTLWKKYVVAKGYPAPTFDHGIRLNDGDEAGDYINKYGDDSELIKTKLGKTVTWDAADEIAKANVKRGRAGNRKPFQILQDAEAGCETSARLFKELVEAFKGKSQLQWSPGLKKVAGVKDEDDQELAAKQDENAKLSFAIPRKIWNQWTRLFRSGKRCRGLLLKSADAGGVDAVCRYMSCNEFERLMYIKEIEQATIHAIEKDSGLTEKSS